MSSRDAISGLRPAIFWDRFFEITQVPRPSGKEEKITAFLEDFFRSRQIPYDKDSAGNLVARVPASPGCEAAPVAVLQAHSDMVCVKIEGSAHQFETDPIQLQQDNGWLTATGTTLGADNGIGLAAALAVIVDEEVIHGPLEILVTVDEERGLNGAKQLPSGLVRGNYLLNMDSEEHGAFYIGCAGGVDSQGTFTIEKGSLPAGDFKSFSLKIDGLKGGHSGADIHLGRANAIKLLVRALHELRELPLHIAQIKGGEARNVLAPKAQALVLIPAESEAKAIARVAEIAKVFNSEYQGI